MNLEFAFLEAAKSLSSPDYSEGAQRYFFYQANPLGYSLLTAGLWKFLHLPAAFWSMRLLSLTGCLAILYSGREWFRWLRPQSNDLFNLWAATTVLCPLVWIYAGRGTADVLPAGLVCLAVTWCWKARGRFLYHLLAGACFSLAAIVKFNSLLIGLGFVFIIWREPAAWVVRGRNLVCYTILPAAVLGVYFAWLQARFGIFLLTDHFKTTHNPFGYVDSFGAVLVLYLSFLAMLPGLLILRPLLLFRRMGSTTKKRLATAVAVALSLPVGMALNGAELGEMKFGGFDYILPPVVFQLLRGGCLILALAMIAEIVYKAIAKAEELSGMLAAAVLPFLIVSSCSRPSQRYLLICLPLVLFHLIATTPRSLRRPTRWLGWASVVVFAGMSFVASWYSVEQGRAAEQMARWIEQHGKLRDTAAGDIEAHAGYHFPLASAATTHFYVSAQPHPDSLHQESVSVMGRKLRTYYLCPRENSTDVAHSSQAAEIIGARRGNQALQ